MTSSLHVSPVLDAEPVVAKAKAATTLVALVIAFCGLLVSTDAGALLGLFFMERLIPSHGQPPYVASAAAIFTAPPN